jgi:hypothetical protein
MTNRPHFNGSAGGKLGLFGPDRIARLAGHPEAIAALARLVMAQISVIAAATVADGGSYVSTMPIMETRDYNRRQSAIVYYFSKSPQPGWLTGVAAAVFTLCEKSGLQPYLAPYTCKDPGASRLIIQCPPLDIPGGLRREDSFMELLRKMTAEGKLRQEAEAARQRINILIGAITQMHAAIARASKPGKTSAVVASFGSPKADSDVRGDSWTGDLIKYCEELGLNVTVDTLGKYRYMGQDTWPKKIIANW